jgi:DNA end-binding protein Ku
VQEEQPLPERDDQQGMGGLPRPFWSGVITFGLVSIPVNLFPANRQTRVSLRMLSPQGHPLSRRYYAPATGRELSDEEMVRGYEIDKHEFVVVTDEELERLAPERSRAIDLRRFVDANEIPPLYFERAYFLIPAEVSEKAYRLLATTMEQTNRAGMATFVMRGKEYLVAMLAENGILRVETLRFSDEIRTPKDVGLPKKGKTSAATVRSFEKSIQSLSKDDISTEEMKDTVAERLFELARKKQARKQDVVKTEAPAKRTEVIDIMEALKRSLGQADSQSRRKSSATAKRSSKRQPSHRRSGHVRERAG